MSENSAKSIIEKCHYCDDEIDDNHKRIEIREGRKIFVACSDNCAINHFAEELADIIENDRLEHEVSSRSFSDLVEKLKKRARENQLRAILSHELKCPDTMQNYAARVAIGYWSDLLDEILKEIEKLEHFEFVYYRGEYGDALACFVKKNDILEFLQKKKQELEK